MEWKTRGPDLIITSFIDVDGSLFNHKLFYMHALFFIPERKPTDGYLSALTLFNHKLFYIKISA